MKKAVVPNGYRQIFKATTLIGGSQVISIVLGIVRTKALAVLLGPSGVGIIGVYGSVTGLVSTFADMGIGNSGVRQIAEATGTGDQERIAKTAITLRRVAFILGAIGAVALVASSSLLSRITFGDSSHAWTLALLSVTIFFGAISAGQTALIQGMRRVSDLAALSVLGSLFGTLFSIPFVYFWAERGIVPFLVATSAAGIGTSWWFARKINVKRTVVTWKDISLEARALLNLGVAFMAANFVTAGTMYAVRTIVVRNLGLDAAGLFQAAATLSTLYIGIILTAMGADFYPRLTAVASDNSAINRLVNEQTEVGLLLALPGIVFTLAFAPPILQMLYSPQFLAAYDVLRWYILGVFLRVICWPLGFIVLAKGKGSLFFWTETIANGLQLSLAAAGIYLFGLAGTGIAFFIMYIVYTLMMIVVAQRLSGFAWSANNTRRLLHTLPLVFLMFIASQTVRESWAMMLGVILTLIATFYSLKCLHEVVGAVDVRDLLGRMMRRRRPGIDVPNEGSPL